MANYTLIANTNFQPFSYEELLKPVAEATKVHRELEDSYGEYGDKAGVWENLLDSEKDNEAYNMYSKYINDLNANIDELAAKGLDNNSRRKWLKMRQRYSKEITPIEQAYANRAKEAEAQYAGREKGIVYEGDAGSSSLDRYLHNPSVRYRSANSIEGFNRVSAAFKSIADQHRKIGRGEPITGYLGTWIEHNGLTRDDALDAISAAEDILSGKVTLDNVLKGVDNNGEEVAKYNRAKGIVASILMDEMHTSGVANWDNPAAQEDYFNRIAPAAYQIIGRSQVHSYQNPFYNSGNRGGSSKKEEVPSYRYQSPIDLGAVGKVTEATKQLLQARRSTGNSVVTPDMEAALAELTELEGKRREMINFLGGDAEFSRYAEIYDKYKELGEKAVEILGSSTNMNAINDYIEKGLKAEGIKPDDPKLDLAIDYFEEEESVNNKVAIAKKVVDDAIQNYGYFSNDNLTNVLMGAKLQDAQEKLIRQRFPYSIDLSEQKNLNNGILSYFNDKGIFENKNSASGIFKVTENGDGTVSYEKQIDYDKFMKKVQTASGKLGASQIAFDFNSKEPVAWMIDGEKYVIRGIESVDNYANSVNKSLSFLKDFKAPSFANENYTDASVIIDSGDIQNIFVNRNISELPGTKDNDIPITEGMSGRIFKYKLPNGSTDVIKVCYNPDNGLIVGYNSLTSELGGQGMLEESLSGPINVFGNDFYRAMVTEPQ